MNSIRITLYAALLVSAFIVPGQDGGEQPDYSIPTFEELVTIPASPEAAAFANYGNLQASMYNGTPSINLPLGVVRGRAFEMPVSLSYDASGIRVNQIATWVGLGWNINLGGTVTREVHGLPDDYLWGSSYLPHYSNPDFEMLLDTNFVEGNPYPAGNVQSYLDHLDKVNSGTVDTEPDTYSFQINGLSGKLVLDPSGQGYCIDRPEIKVTPVFVTVGDVRRISAWHLVDGYGTEYRFEDIEVTHTYESGQTEKTRTYTSAWHISQITTASNRDVVQFDYDKTLYTGSFVGTDFWDDNQASQPVIVREEVDPGQTVGETVDCGTSGLVYSTSAETKIRQLSLTKVWVNGSVALQVTQGANRPDLAGGKLPLESLDFRGVSGTTVKHIEFNYSYFGDETSPNSNVESRLRLDSFDEYGHLQKTSKSYSFDYFGGGAIPSRLSMSQDFWGYYNGKSNTTLIPYDATFDAGSASFVGADRSVSFTDAKTGTLKSITYPTGGSTEFVYESNWDYVNETTSQVVTELHASVSLYGGAETTGDPIEYVACTGDTEGDIPKSKYHEFEITGPDPVDVTISYELSGTVGGTAVLYGGVYQSVQCPDPPDPHCLALDEDRKYCSLLNDPMVAKWTGVLSNQSVTATLQPGFYTVALLNTNPNMIVRVKVESQKTVLNTTLYEEVGGLRIKKMIDKPDGSQSIERFFYYGDLSSVDKSLVTKTYLLNERGTSGTLHVTPNFRERKHFQRQTSNPYSGGLPVFDTFTCSKDVRYSTNLNRAHGPHITYPVVTEVIMLDDNTTNGFTVHEYYDKQTSSSAPFDFEPLNGKDKHQRIYDSNWNLMQETNYNWSETSLGFVKGFYFKASETNLEGIEIYNDSGGQSFFYDENPTDGCLGEHATGGRTLASCIGYTGGPRYVKHTFGVTRHFIKNNSTETKSYTAAGEGPFVTRIDNAYSSVNYQTNTVTTQLSGEIRETDFLYPHEESHYDSLFEEHRRSEVVGRKETIGGQVIYETKTRYNGQNLKSEINVAPDGSLMETRVHFKEYDIHHNPIEIERDGFSSMVLWGYNYSLPVAIIRNATKTEVETIFPLPSSTGPINNLTEFLSYIQLLPEGDLIDKLGALRTGLPNAEIQIYTHKPGLGISTFTDPNGLTIRYHYDDLNRLKATVDHNDDILQLVQYNYKN